MTTPTSPLTHFDAQGQAHMVDVAAKAATHRIAVAHGRIAMKPATLALIVSGSAKKGDVLGIARIAGIMAAKKTSDLIPLCHPLAVTRVALEFVTAPATDGETGCVTCTATVETAITTIAANSRWTCAKASFGLKMSEQVNKVKGSHLWGGEEQRTQASYDAA